MGKSGDGFERLSGMSARNLVLDLDAGKGNVYFSSGTACARRASAAGAVRTLVADAGQTADLAIDGE